MNNRYSAMHNSTVDFLKGICILMVVLTHFEWSGRQRLFILFPYFVNMAVPIFMIISGYVCALSFHRKNITSLSDAYSLHWIMPRFLRYTIPFLLVTLWQIIDLNIILPLGKLNKLKWFLNGISGPGSYYYPLLIQFIFIFPILYFALERKGNTGLWIYLAINAVYELLQWSYGINDESYRLIFFRYIFLISTGIYAVNNKFSFLKSIIMTTLGGLFIALLVYGHYETRIINQSWAVTSFLAVMWIIPSCVFLIQKYRYTFHSYKFYW